nr:MAG TPA: hypothetical protein [Caudoviricetes sp.]
MTVTEIISIASSVLSLVTIGVGVGKFSQKVSSLEEKVDKHNHVIERVFRLEDNIGRTDIGVLQAEQKHLVHDVEQLKEEMKQCQKNQ